MEYGCPKDKRFGAIDGGNLTGFSVMELKKFVCCEKLFLGKREIADFGRVLPGEASTGILSEITTDPSTMPENSKEYVMTEIPGLNYKDVGNLYGYRNWVEYGLNQSKNELGSC